MTTVVEVNKISERFTDSSYQSTPGSDLDIDKSTLMTTNMEIDANNNTDLSMGSNVPNSSKYSFIFNDKDKYYDPDGIYFIIKVMHMTSAGSATNFAANEANWAFAPSPCFFFNRVALKLGSTQIESCDSFDTSNYIMELLYTSREYATTSAQIEGFYPYTDSGIINGETGKLIRDRMAAVADNGTIDTKAPIFSYYKFIPKLGFFNDLKKYLKTPFEVTFWRNFESRAYACPDRTHTPAFKIQRMQMIVPIKVPSQDIIPALDAQFINQSNLYQFTTFTCRAFGIKKTDTRITQVVDTTSARPKAVIFAFQKVTRTDGAATSLTPVDVPPNGATNCNPAFFDSLQYSQMYLKVGGQYYPQVPIIYTAGENKAEDSFLSNPIRNYEELLKISSKNKNFWVGSLIGMNDYKNKYPLLCFDLSANQKNIPEPNNTSVSNLSLDATFKAPDVDMNAYMICLYDVIIEVIGQSGTVVIRSGPNTQV